MVWDSRELTGAAGRVYSAVAAGRSERAGKGGAGSGDARRPFDRKEEGGILALRG